MTQQMIKLTLAQATAVKGKYNGWGLTPIKIDRYYYLPVDVLDNQAYSEVLPTLSTLPIVELEIVEQNND